MAGKKNTGATKRAQPVEGMTRDDVDSFERLQAQLQSLHQEMQTLVRKSPNDRLNKFKLGLINLVLAGANKLLSDGYTPFAGFTVFADEELPSNSDVMIILSQYLSSMESMRADNIRNDMGTWYWMIDGVKSTIRTLPPKKLHKPK